MLSVAVKGVAARKLRAALTALAVALGVTLIAGTYVFTDTINASFDSIFQQGAKGVDVSITPKDTVAAADGGSPPAFPATLLAKVRGVEGVALASGAVFNDGVIYKKNGEPTSTAAPTFIDSVRPQRFSPWNYAQGRAPAGPDEVALDQFTADRAGYKLGQQVGVSGETPLKRYRVVGIAKYGDVASFGGAGIAILTLPEAQRVTGEQGRFDEIQVGGEAGTTPAELKARVAEVAPPTVNVRTGLENADQQSQDIRENLGFLRTILLVFAGVSVFVGAFIIFNTFSITVTQRMREFALLRTLGATRRQVLRSVLTEGLVIGILGSLVGLGLGLLLAPGLNALFKAFGADLPNNGLVVEPRTIIVALLVGTIVTVLAGLPAALRATSVPPVAALREGAVLPRTRASRLALPLAVVLLVLGFALLLLGLFVISDSTGAASTLGGGAVLIFLGVAVLSPRLVRPIASAVGYPLERVRGLEGRLARENSVRQPGRTAVTAAALMIGLTLVAFVTIFAAGLKGSVEDAVAKTFGGSLVLQSSDGFTPFSNEAAALVARQPGVEQVAGVRFVDTKLAPSAEDVTASGVDPRPFASLYKAELVAGTRAGLAALGPQEAFAKENWAKDHDVKVGDQVRALTAQGGLATFTIRGIYKKTDQLLSDITIPNSVMARDFRQRKDQFVFVGVRPGADVKAVQQRIDRALASGFPSVESFTKQEFIDDQGKQVNQVLAFVYVLLSLAVIVSLFGIVNTLVLSITERTRELGMLRAIGTSRRQVRRVIRYESIITALIGAVLGIVLGVIFSVIVSRPLADEGFTLSIPVGTLLVLLVLAGLAGVLAAILPARRASRIDVLQALAYE